MNYHLILFYLISFILHQTNSVNLNIDSTDALTLEEYEDDDVVNELKLQVFLNQCLLYIKLQHNVEI
jgi:hypothetical protein